VKKIYTAARVVTCDAARAGSSADSAGAGSPLGVIEDGAVLIEDARVAWVGRASDAPRDVDAEDFGARVITPGLVDAHTHAAWAGSRDGEYAMKMRGADYREIAAAGGGILSTHRAIAAISEEDLARDLAARLTRMASLGVTTCEVKSGYGLTRALEEKQLRAIATAAKNKRAPHVVPTFLALHALPAEARDGADAKEKRDAYVDRVVTEHVPKIADAKLARFLDAYVDANAFTVDEARRACDAATARGLSIRLHVGQFADIGGARLAADVGARSVDHVEHIGNADARLLAEKGVFCTLLPIASFTLKQEPPPVAMLRAAGVRFVVASDANPGTAPSESLPLAMAFAVRFYGLSPDETILAATKHAAQSLDEPERGVISPGNYADLVIWDLPHEHAIVQPWGTSKIARVIRDGLLLAD
jgi:imidazolonepropionase